MQGKMASSRRSCRGVRLKAEEGTSGKRGAGVARAREKKIKVSESRVVPRASKKKKGQTVRQASRGRNRARRGKRVKLVRGKKRTAKRVTARGRVFSGDQSSNLAVRHVRDARSEGLARENQASTEGGLYPRRCGVEGSGTSAGQRRARGESRKRRGKVSWRASGSIAVSRIGVAGNTSLFCIAQKR